MGALAPRHNEGVLANLFYVPYTNLKKVYRPEIAAKDASIGILDHNEFVDQQAALGKEVPFGKINLWK